MDPVTTTIDSVQCAVLDSLNQNAQEWIQDSLPTEYLSMLTNDDEKIDALCTCLIIWILTRGTIVPHIFQLQASLAMLHHCDTVIFAGTGAGKMLCLLIPMLLHPGLILITISPLEHLQTSQVRNRFLETLTVYKNNRALMTVENMASAPLLLMKIPQMIENCGRYGVSELSFIRKLNLNGCVHPFGWPG